LGAKTVTIAKLRDCFVFFFLRGQNRNFGKVRGLKLQLSLKTMAGGAEASEKATISAYNRSSSSFVKYIFVTVNMKDWV